MDTSETKKSLVPKISIVIPFFNSDLTLTRAVNSVLIQDFSDWELILVNDGSTDQSESIACSFLADRRISYVYQKNGGVSAARNLGASKAKGDWLLFLDSDDALGPDILEKMNELVSGDGIQDYFHFGVCSIQGQERIERFPTDSGYLGKLAGSFLLKKSIFHQVGGYDEILKFSENTELFHRIHLLPIKNIKVPYISLEYYVSKQGGSKNIQNILESLIYILKKHDDTLSSHVKYLYHQSAGVIYIRFDDLFSARFHLKQALKFKPWKLTAWARLGLTFIPPLARMIYKRDISIA
ncbi:glycosyltransferase family 2 protein [Algoriphagus formosus]|uniref:Glycosyltransferase family 2 protein n=1 Tax=Algoriphagus formosus TaxID=2007308 RepID=A0A4R5UVP0_9BACT|nr:glycosyltransferase family A protein [Algoriphagus aquimaris]TDK43324.1 glycosyltransferase family 2 protein [Algoriphagus aquimaris]